MIFPAKPTIYAICAGGIFAGGMALGWRMRAPKPGRLDPPAAAIRQSDGSLIPERKPDPSAKPAQEIPEGAVVERIMYATIKPRPSGAAPLRTTGGDRQDEGGLVAVMPCPPVRMDMTQIRLPDQTRRMILSSPDGEVTDGMDIPVDAAPEPKPIKWALGPSFNPIDKTYGVVGERDFSFLPIRAGAHVFQQRLPITAGGGVKGAAQVWLVWRF